MMLPRACYIDISLKISSNSSCPSKLLISCDWNHLDPLPLCFWTRCRRLRVYFHVPVVQVKQNGVCLWWSSLCTHPNWNWRLLGPWDLPSISWWLIDSSKWSMHWNKWTYIPIKSSIWTNWVGGVIIGREVTWRHIKSKQVWLITKFGLVAIMTTIDHKRYSNFKALRVWMMQSQQWPRLSWRWRIL